MAGRRGGGWWWWWSSRVLGYDGTIGRRRGKGYDLATTSRYGAADARTSHSVTIYRPRSSLALRRRRVYPQPSFLNGEPARADDDGWTPPTPRPPASHPPLRSQIHCSSPRPRPRIPDYRGDDSNTRITIIVYRAVLPCRKYRIEYPSRYLSTYSYFDIMCFEHRPTYPQQPIV